MREFLKTQMSAVAHKHESITRMLDELRVELGNTTFDIVDHWDSDSHAVGIARPDNHAVLVYISTHDGRKNKFWFSLELPAQAVDEYVAAGDGQAQGIEELASVVRAHFEFQRES